MTISNLQSSVTNNSNLWRMNKNALAKSKGNYANEYFTFLTFHSHHACVMCQEIHLFLKVKFSITAERAFIDLYFDGILLSCTHNGLNDRL